MRICSVLFLILLVVECMGNKQKQRNDRSESSSRYSYAFPTLQSYDENQMEYRSPSTNTDIRDIGNENVINDKINIKIIADRDDDITILDKNDENRDTNDNIVFFQNQGLIKTDGKGSVKLEYPQNNIYYELIEKHDEKNMNGHLKKQDEKYETAKIGTNKEKYYESRQNARGLKRKSKDKKKYDMNNNFERNSNNQRKDKKEKPDSENYNNEGENQKMERVKKYYNDFNNAKRKLRKIQDKTKALRDDNSDDDSSDDSDSDSDSDSDEVSWMAPKGGIGHIENIKNVLQSGVMTNQWSVEESQSNGKIKKLKNQQQKIKTRMCVLNSHVEYCIGEQTRNKK